MELQEIGSSVYACLQKDRGLGWSNSGLINRAGGLVIDTFWDLPHTRELIENYSRVWKTPARRVVNTHHNGDHCWGNQLFEGAEIIGHRLCAEGMKNESPELLQMMKGMAGNEDAALAGFARALKEWDFTGITPTPPTTFIEGRMNLNLEGLDVHLIHVGPAHTGGDVVVHLPEQRVVFTGDVLFRRCTPIGWDGTFAKWTQALDDIVALAPEVIVPGHGPLCGIEGPREMKAYLEYGRREARRCFDGGVPASEASRRTDLGPYAGWTEPARIIFNVERAYREFRGDPYDAPIDVQDIIRNMFTLQQEPKFARV